MAEPIYKGSLVYIKGYFRDDDPDSATYGQLVDPTTVSFTVIDPTPTTTTYVYPTVIVKLAVGVYRMGISCTASGNWKWRFFATGTGQASIEGQFPVEASNF